MSRDINNLGQKAIHAFRWTLLAEVVNKCLSPIIFIFLARILNPYDYGVAASSLVVIAFTQIFSESSLGRALVQRKSNVVEASYIIFWSSLVISSIIYVTLFLFADYIGEYFFKDQRVGDVIKILGLCLPFNSLSVVQVALLQRNLEFKKIFVINSSVALISGLMSLYLAYLGWGYWALTAGSLSTSVLRTIALWKIVPWRVKLEYNKGIARELYNFCAWTTGTAFLLWFYSWMDTLLVGIFLDSKSMGLYRVGTSFDVTIFNLLFGSISPVLYSALSRLQNNIPKVRYTLITAIQFSAFLAIPLSAFIFSGSTSIVDIVFGKEWVGAASVVGWYALMLGIHSTVRFNADAYRAIGRPDLETKIMLVCSIIYIPAYIISLSKGFNEFVITRFLIAILGIGIQTLYAKRYLNIHPIYILRLISIPLIVGLTIIFLNKILVRVVDLSSYYHLAVLIIVSAIIGFIFGVIPQHKKFKQILFYIRRI